MLSPAFDLLPVDVIMPEDGDQFALSLNGKRRIFVGRVFLCLRRNAEWHEAPLKK